MTSEWDGTAWGGTPASKTEVGPGVAMMRYHSPLIEYRRTPQAMMREAQRAYQSNPWVGLAESTVTRKVVGLDWHLEDDKDEEWPEDASGAAGIARQLLERPQARLPGGVRQPATATRRGMTAITSRHIGLCGMAFWYLDSLDAIGRIPLGILYLNPARMWPAEDEYGNLTGWILDPKDEQGRGGTPLDLEEVLPFYLDPPDYGNLGTGLYQRAALKAQITNLADQHAAYVLGTGGRIAGLISPKEGSIPDEAYKKLVAEFRNVAEAPDAAKRMTILQGPIDFTPTAADPSGLDLVDISKMNRDDILAIWGVPPSQAAVPTSSGGLNSGETRKYEEAVLMQGSVHDRVVSLVETIQTGLLDRFLSVGTTVEYEIEEPEFDDQAPLYEMAAKAKDLPLTNRERREILGLEPFGDARDEDVWLPAVLSVAYGPGKAAPAVAPPPPEGGFPEGIAGLAEAMKARGETPFVNLRKSIDERTVPRMAEAVRRVLEAQRREIVAALRKDPDILRKRNDTSRWWKPDRENERMMDAVRPFLAAIVESVTGRAREVLGPTKAEDPFTESVLDDLTKRVGLRIVDINRTTLNAVRDAIRSGFAEGMSPLQIAETIQDLPAFDLIRADTVARTETMFTYNGAALGSYREYGVEMVEAIDGDQDEVCAARNGKIFPVTEAYDILDHPNGTLDWVPIYEPVAKASPRWTHPQPVEKPQTLRVEIGQPTEPPVVNVTTPDITVTPAPVDLSPVVEAVKALQEDIRASQKTATRRSVERDAQGRIVAVVEE